MEISSASLETNGQCKQEIGIEIHYLENNGEVV